MTEHGHWNAFRRVVIACLATIALTSWPPAVGGLFVQAAQAQDVSVSVEFRTALDPYGRWYRHSRWGEVWVPSRVDRDWRPYELGRWIYTDDWGWYWESDEDFGWIVYHYGRWVFDPDLSWVWVPAREWAPAWVQWRRGSQYVGWAPLPPDEIVVEYRDEPDVWVFVRARDFTAPRIATVILPPRERTIFMRETVVVNRTVVVRDRGPRIAVNPGIPPSFIATAVGRPLRAYEVRPRILAGTARIEGAVEVTREDLRGRRIARERAGVRQTQTVIRPADRVPRPEPLGVREEGRLGDSPPRAARRDRGPGGAEQERQREGRDARDRLQWEEQGRDAEERRQREQQRGRGAEQQRLREQQRGREVEEQRQRELRSGREAQEQRQRELSRGREAQEQRQRELSRGREAQEQRQRELRRGREVEEQRQRELRRGREAQEQRQRELSRGREAQEERQRELSRGREAQEQRQRELRRGREVEEQHQRELSRGREEQRHGGARETERRGSRIEGPRGPGGPPALDRGRGGPRETTGTAPTRDLDPPRGRPQAPAHAQERRGGPEGPGGPGGPGGRGAGRGN